MENIFPDNNYKTPVEIKRTLIDRMFFGTRFWFYQGILRHFIEYSNEIKTTGMNAESFMGHAQRMTRFTETCGATFIIEGMDNISKVPGPVVFIGNHMSMLETFLLPGMIISRQKEGRNVTFVIKASLIDYPFFGTIMRSLDPICVTRTNPREDLKQVLNKGQEILERGEHSVVIFPQSTRSPHFDPETFNTIGVKLARKAGVPIIPLALKTDFLANGSLLKDFGPIHRERALHFAFGEPMEINGTGKDEHQVVSDFILEKQRQWNKEK